MSEQNRNVNYTNVSVTMINPPKAAILTQGTGTSDIPMTKFACSTFHGGLFPVVGTLYDILATPSVGKPISFSATCIHSGATSDFERN